LSDVLFVSVMSLLTNLVKSYQTTAFAEQILMVQERIREENQQRDKRKNSVLRKTILKTREERNDLTLITMLDKIDSLTSLVKKQDKTINELRSEFNHKIEGLKCY